MGRVDELLEGANLRRAANSFPRRTGHGADCLPIAYLALLPAYIWDSISSVLRQFARTLCLPQLLSHRISISHAQEGWRGGTQHGVFASLTRIMMKALAPLFRHWDGATAIAGDSAAAGAGGAEWASYQACATDEAWAAFGHVIIRSLWDLRKFYDTVPPVALAQACLKHGLPAIPTALSFWGHAGTRYISYQGQFSEPIQGYARSIVAGCTSSTSLARALLLDPLQAAAAAAPSCTQTAHVDDVTQMAHSESSKAACEEAVLAGAVFCQEAV